MIVKVRTVSGSTYEIVCRDDGKKFISGGRLGAREGAIVEIWEEIKVGNTLNLTYHPLDWYCHESPAVNSLRTNIISEVIVNF